MSGSLDTSALVQLVTRQTPALADRIMQKIERSKKQFAIADAAIIELVFVLEKVKAMHRKDIVTVIDMLTSQKVFNFNRVLFAEAMPMYQKYPALSIQDCCLAAYANLTDARPLWTFDQKLAKQSPYAELI